MNESPPAVATPADLKIVPASVDDVPTILALIRQLAEYEKLLHEVVATEALLHQAPETKCNSVRQLTGPCGGDCGFEHGDGWPFPSSTSPVSPHTIPNPASHFATACSQ